MIDHCISAFSERRERDRYREYVSECLRVLTENTAKMSQGSIVKATYKSFVKKKPEAADRHEEPVPGEVTENIRSKFR